MPDIETLSKDRQAFNAFIYMSLPDALEELSKRRQDTELVSRVEKFLGEGLPEIFKQNPRLVLARHLVTLDHEITRFLNVSDSVAMPPLFFEYLNDKLVYKNSAKYKLARVSFFKGFGKKGGVKRDEIQLIDFDKAHGKPISTVQTLGGGSLVDFHHKLFLSRFPHLKDALFDGSEWYSKNGGIPAKYYSKFLALFVCHGILFENFFLDRKEFEFTTQIFLPAFIEVLKECGVRPLVVALEPTHIEGDEFWLDHPYAHKALVEKWLNLAPQQEAPADLEIRQSRHL